MEETADLICSGPRQGKAPKTAHAHMGMLVRDEDLRFQGVTLAIRGGRVMRPRSRIGLGPDPTPRLYGFVEVSQGWEISKNKDGMSQADEALLGEHISSRFRHLIEHAKNAAVDVEFRGHNAVLKLLPVAIRRRTERMRKAKRQPPSHPTGAVLPTHTGSPHRRAAVTQPGRRFPELRGADGRFFQISPVKKSPDQPLFVVEEPNDSGTILTLNTGHPAYSHLESQDALVPAAIVFFACYKERAEGKLPFPDPDLSPADRQAYIASEFLRAWVDASRLAAQPVASVS